MRIMLKEIIKMQLKTFKCGIMKVLPVTPIQDKKATTTKGTTDGSSYGADVLLAEITTNTGNCLHLPARFPGRGQAPARKPAGKCKQFPMFCVVSEVSKVWGHFWQF